jgi:hypothetical protein
MINYQRLGNLPPNGLKDKCLIGVCLIVAKDVSVSIKLCTSRSGKLRRHEQQDG